MGMLINRHRNRHQGEDSGAGSSVDEMTVKELKAYADEHDIDLSGASKKDEIRDAIHAAETVSDPDPDDDEQDATADDDGDPDGDDSEQGEGEQE